LMDAQRDRQRPVNNRIVVPGRCALPATGSVAITGRVGEPSTPATGNPAIASVCVAWVTDMPATFGTGRGAGPFDTCTSICVPLGTWALSGCESDITSPA